MRAREETIRSSPSIALALCCLVVCLATNGLPAAAQANEGTVARDLAIAVNDSLTRYIDVHNYLFKVTPGRLIPIPGVFEAIDFKVYTQRLDGINADLVKGKTHLVSLQRAGLSMVEARECVEALDEFTDALISTVAALRNVSFQLYEKSHDSAKYSWGTYQKDMRVYQASIDKYTFIGQRLNPLFTRLDDALKSAK